jgi:hypothetical protein
MIINLKSYVVTACLMQAYMVWHVSLGKDTESTTLVGKLIDSFSASHKVITEVVVTRGVPQLEGGSTSSRDATGYPPYITFP